HERAVIESEKYAGKKLRKLQGSFQRHNFTNCDEAAEYLNSFPRKSALDAKWRLLEDCYELEEKEHSYAEEAK
ncbi:hypothetical protein Pmar_PMAR012373, partial [Perkinsus marinus ATCC 50983]